MPLWQRICGVLRPYLGWRPERVLERVFIGIQPPQFFAMGESGLRDRRGVVGKVTQALELYYGRKWSGVNFGKLIALSWRNCSLQEGHKTW